MRKVLTAFLALLMLVTTLTPAMAVSLGLPNVVVPNYPDGAVLHLPFDEGSGTTAYNAVNPTTNSGTLLDANATNADGDTPPQWVTGIVGTALQFDGVDDYVEVQGTSGLTMENGFTVIFWANTTPSAATNHYRVINKWVATTGWQFSFYGGLAYFHIWTDTGEKALIAPVPDGEHFYAIKWDGNSQYLYIDGNLVATKSASGNITTNTGNIKIGIGGGIFYKGILDEVMVFDNSTLTDEEIKLLYELTKPHKFSSQPTITPVSIPVIDINTNQTAVVRLMESTTESSAYLPIPVGARNVNPASWVYTVNGDVLQFDDNRYVNASSVIFDIPLQIISGSEDPLPSELVLDSSTETFTYRANVNIYNPSDIELLGVVAVDPTHIGLPLAQMGGMTMLFDDENGLLKNAAKLQPGSNTFEITASLTLDKREVEYRASFEDFLTIDSFDDAVKASNSMVEGKLETVVKVISIDSSADFRSYGNRSVVIPLDVKPDDVIEAKALTGSKELLEIREGKDGRAEIVVPSTAFEGDLLDMQHAEIKVIYNKKPAWWESIPFLKSLSGFFEFLKKLFGGG